MPSSLRSPDSVEVADGAGAVRSLYVHLPFCRRRCPYCDFAVVALDEGTPDVSGYTQALIAEMAMLDEWEPLDAVNLGGGTPSATPLVELELILGAIETRFEIAGGAEVSLEVNPEDVTTETAAGWAALGFNRVSLGVQSFDDDVLRALGRSHTASQATTATRIALDAGFDSVSLDLIFGAPVETTDSWRLSMKQATSLGTQHLSTYALTVELGTELSRQVSAGAPAPDADHQADRYEIACELAAAAGLVRYEVSNFALPGAPARYNLGTWAQGEYEAVGLGAHGHRGGVRYRNVRRLDAYLGAIERGDLPRAGQEQIRDREVVRERLMLGVRRTAGVDVSDVLDVLGRDASFQRLVEAGVAEISGGRLRVLDPLLTDEVSRMVLGLDLG